MLLTPTLQMRRAELKARARGEFLDMPGLCLTLAQASRLCGASADDCQWVLNELVADRFLRRAGAVYRRAATGRRCA
jgi:hypothetical protein